MLLLSVAIFIDTIMEENVGEETKPHIQRHCLVKHMKIISSLILPSPIGISGNGVNASGSTNKILPQIINKGFPIYEENNPKAR